MQSHQAGREAMPRNDATAENWPQAIAVLASAHAAAAAPAAPHAAPEPHVPSHSAWARPVRGGLPLWRLKRVLVFIDDNLGRDIALADLADVARLSAHHFSELFRQSMGTSPYRYVLDRRIECAKVLLRDSVLGVLDIALAVGFSDQSHFSKVFRRATGMAPGMYRAAA
jgi:transcriptional regulator GlxA family with amidase domain